MATTIVNPGGFASAYAAAANDDTLILQPGVHTFPSTFSKRLYVTASDAAVGKAVTGTTGHNGTGMGVKVTGVQNYSSGAKGAVFRGIWLESSNAQRGPGSHLDLGGVGWEDCVFNNRTVGGAGMILITLGSASSLLSDGTAYAKRCRFHKIGDSKLDHALYFKNIDSWLDEDCLFYDISGYAWHFYGNPRNCLSRRFVSDRCGKVQAGGVTFSGANDSSTGFSGCFFTRDCVLEDGHITNTQSGPAGTYACVESWWGCTVGTGNIVRNTNLNQASGSGSRLKSGLSGVTTQNLLDVVPGYADPINGDFRLSAGAPGVGLGPTYIQPTGTPPPAPSSVSNIIAEALDTRVEIEWTHSGVFGTDWDRMSIRRSTSTFPNTINDGTEIFSGTNETSYADTAVVNGTTYFYSAFRFLNNTPSPPAFISATPSAGTPPPPPPPPDEPAPGEAKFGKTTIGSTWRGMSPDYKRASAYNVQPLKQITKIIVRMRGIGSTGTQSVRAFAYQDGNGALLGVTAAQALSNALSEQWVTFTPASPIVLPSAGGMIRLGLHSDTGTGELQIATDIVAGAMMHGADTYSDGTAASWVNPSFDQYQISICAVIGDVAASAALAGAATITISAAGNLAEQTPGSTPIPASDVVYRAVDVVVTYTIPTPFQVSTGAELYWDSTDEAFYYKEP